MQDRVRFQDGWRAEEGYHNPFSTTSMDLSDLTRVLNIATAQEDMAAHTFYGRMCRVPIANKENDTSAVMCLRSISVVVYTTDAAPRGMLIYSSAKRWLDMEVECVCGRRPKTTRALFWHNAHVVEVVDCATEVVVAGPKKRRCE